MMELFFFCFSIIISVIDLWKQDTAKYEEIWNLQAHSSAHSRPNDFGDEKQSILGKFLSRIR
jgi:hypothetical protein